MTIDQSQKQMKRRDFVEKTTKVAAAIAIVPSHVVAGLGHKPPSDKLNIAAVGVGGMGGNNLSAMENENIVALCDIDHRYSKETFNRYPKAKIYTDWRKMYGEMKDSFDAVLVATADHTHAVVASHAMTLGKHVYVQKPLTHSIYESRLLTNLAKKYRVATSMGNQGASGDGVRTTNELIWSGRLGDITRVDSLTNRPIWPQGLNVPTKKMRAPGSLDWDLFIGPAKMREFNEIYTPWNWRGWWDFGTGALGDMACHILHPVFTGLKLGYPIRVQGSSSMLLNDCAPTAQAVQMIFPKRPGFGDVKEFPEVEVNWFDGGLKPNMPIDWPEGTEMMKYGGGAIFYGTKDTLVVGCYGRDPWLISGDEIEVEPRERKIESTHEEDWIRACKESPESRTETTSAFYEAGPFNEMVVMGVNAVRLQGLNKILEWDGENMEFTNIGDSESIKFVRSDDFAMKKGRPKFDKTFTDPINAKAFAQELVQHTYRSGWSLPEMPDLRT